MIPFFDLTKQYASIQSELDAATARVMKSGWFILGPEVAAFEKEFTEYIGTRHALGVGSGTEAIHIALLALGVGAGEFEDRGEIGGLSEEMDGDDRFGAGRDRAFERRDVHQH